MSTTATHHRPGVRTVTRHVPQRPLREESGVRFGLAHAWLVVCTTACLAVGLHGLAVLVPMTATVLLAARGLGPGWTAALGLSTWAVWTGFVENGLGVLTLAPDDLTRMGLLVVASMLGTVLPRGRRTRLGA